MSIIPNIPLTNYPYLYGPYSAYGLLSMSTITSTGTTTINNGVYGNLTEDIAGTINGTSDFSDVSNALIDLNTLISDIYQLNIPPTSINGTQTGTTINFTPGGYNFQYQTPVAFTSCTINFDASNNPNAQFVIFNPASSTTLNGCTINLLNGANPANIFWMLSQTTSGPGTSAATFANVPTIYGTVISFQSITVTTTTTTNINGNLFVATGPINITTTTINTTTSCYLKGTKILTDKGYVAIENITEQDKIATCAEIHKNQYIELDSIIYSFSSISCIKNFKITNLTKDSLPICIKAGAYAENMPFEDLFVSPRHRMLIDGIMIEAKDLINDTTIFQDYTKNNLEYYHIELNTHSAIIANGVLSESFLNYNNVTKKPISFTKSNFTQICV
jgi:hypothetical protein